TYTIKDKNILLKEKEKAIIDKVKDFFFEEEKVQQDDREIAGKVVDKNGQTLAGVNINVKGTDIRTSTDQNGSYTLRIPSEGNATLVFSSVGFMRQEIAVNQQKTLDVTLLESISNLDEIVVVGYGTQ